MANPRQTAAEPSEVTQPTGKTTVEQTQTLRNRMVQLLKSVRDKLKRPTKKPTIELRP